MSVLRSRLLQQQIDDENAKLSAQRKSLIGSGDRSEKIRTYNFPDNRCSDHRIKLTLHSLDRIMEGELQPVIDALISADRTAKLSE